MGYSPVSVTSHGYMLADLVPQIIESPRICIPNRYLSTNDYVTQK